MRHASPVFVIGPVLFPAPTVPRLLTSERVRDSTHRVRHPAAQPSPTPAIGPAPLPSRGRASSCVPPTPPVHSRKTLPPPSSGRPSCTRQGQTRPPCDPCAHLLTTDDPVPPKSLAAMSYCAPAFRSPASCVSLPHSAHPSRRRAPYPQYPAHRACPVDLPPLAHHAAPVIGSGSPGTAVETTRPRRTMMILDSAARDGASMMRAEARACDCLRGAMPDPGEGVWCGMVCR